MMLKINRALVSLSDKSGLETLAGTLKKHQIAVLSTGKTAEALAGFGISVSSVAEVTGFPERLGGRVKTLHPAIHAGILARKGHREDLRDLEQEGIEHIDLVIVNLYPFAAVRRRGGSAEEIIENIDIGGITLIRAAAKNHHNVVLITSPDDYEALGRELDAHSGKVSDAFRRARVRDAFLLTADYDRQIASYFAADYHREAPESSVFLFGGYAAKELRYGENPHQTGTFYADAMPPVGLAAAKLLQGKEPSYNNYADADMALRIVRSFTEPACAIIKHAQSCGVAERGGPADAYRAAYRADPESAFGGVIAFNSALDRETALAVSEQFAELVIAPEILPEAAEIFKKKRNLRVFVVGETENIGDASGRQTQPMPETRKVNGGWLLQSPDNQQLTEEDLRWVTPKPPDTSVVADLIFAWQTVRFCRSNAIVIAKNRATCGIGAGQTSRVFAVRSAIMRAKDNGAGLKDAVLASDGFFPFADSVALIAEAGITAVIQPGGSKRDEEVTEAARRHGIAMAFTGYRCFWHG